MQYRILVEVVIHEENEAEAERAVVHALQEGLDWPGTPAVIKIKNTQLA